MSKLVIDCINVLVYARWLNNSNIYLNLYLSGDTWSLKKNISFYLKSKNENDYKSYKNNLIKLKEII
jgi:hypothetical protein